LKPRPEFRYGNPEISIHTLRLAILSGEIDIFHFLIGHSPGLLNLIRLEPWIVLEAAAVTSTFWTIEQYRLEINKTNELGMGSPLAAAVVSEDMDLARQLVERGASLRSVLMKYSTDTLGHYDKDTWYPTTRLDGMAALHLAVLNEDEEMVEFLISKGADVDQCCHPGGESRRDSPIFPIQIATYLENEFLIDMLINAGADPNSGATEVFEVPDGVLEKIKGRPAVRIALETGNATIFDQLLGCGAVMPTNMTHIGGWDPLVSSILGMNYHLVKRICKDFVQADQEMHEGLAACIQHCGCDLAKEIIDLGSLRSEDIYHKEVLRAAVQRGNTDFVQLMLTGAKASLGRLPPGYGRIGFAAAMACKYFDMTSMFLNAGIKPYESIPGDNEDGRSALANALSYGKPGASPLTTHQFELLINACEKPLTGPREEYVWKFALYDACINAIASYPAFVMMILAKGIDINWAPRGRATFLQKAIQCHLYRALEDECFGTEQTEPQHSSKMVHSSLVSTLLRHGADVSAPPGIEYGATALQSAVMDGNFEVLNMLLKAGASINEPPGKCGGRTAIEGAAEHGRLNMVSYLLEAGADVKGRENQNYRKNNI
jgi:ankyrin repeat protein